MAKKNFTDGLENLLQGDPEEKDIRLSEGKEGEGQAGKTNKRKASGKDFSAGLDDLLQEALRESVEEHTSRKGKKGKTVAKTQHKKERTSRIRKSLTGLDALIRQTLNQNEEVLEPETERRPKKKRVTFSFDREKVDKLKHIARMEKSFIKDIVSSIVTEYIEEYEDKKGKV